MVLGFKLSRTIGTRRRVPNLTQPTQIPDTHSFVQISAGDQFSLALDSNEHVWSFGNGDFGRLGLGEGVGNRFRPTRIESLSNIKSISAGFTLELFWIILDHCGHSDTMDYGQLGLGDNTTGGHLAKLKEFLKSFKFHLGITTV
jgi:alpha-tubulin suppressor-like RCC1 family protein